MKPKPRIGKLPPPKETFRLLKEYAEKVKEERKNRANEEAWYADGNPNISNRFKKESH
jgi:hypothetical protein